MIRAPSAPWKSARAAAEGERGYAMIAVLAAIAAFGLLALDVGASARSAAASADAELERARLSADVDAGVAIAVHGLGLVDPGRRWRIDGERRETEFDGAVLTISVEDEAGKLPLNFIAPRFIERLFTLAGADPETVQTLTQGVLTLRAGDQAAQGDPRGGHAISSLDQIAALSGMTPAIYARIAPAVTVASPVPAFDSRTASPLAFAVMGQFHLAGDGMGPPPRESENAISPVGRTLTIRVEAKTARGSQMRKTVIVEVTGARARPFVIRAVD